MDKKNKFSIGDLVELKSGGPTMTVSSINDETLKNKRKKELHNMFGMEEESPTQEQKFSYTCKWFAGKKSDQDVFMEEMLELSNKNLKK